MKIGNVTDAITLSVISQRQPIVPARIFHELASRDREDGRATGQPQELGPEAYWDSTSQGSRSEDAQKDDHIHGRSRQFMKYAG